MRKVISFIFSFLLTSILAYAQNDGKSVNFIEQSSKISITGKIVNGETKEPIEFSTVTLISPIDSSIITWGLSNDQGNFNISTFERNFVILIEFLACQDKFINPNEVPIGQSKLDLGSIELIPRTLDLEGVEVFAQKPMIMMSLDKRVVNVEKNLVSEGGTAEDILRNVPGIWMDIDGNLSLRNSDNVRILLDGQSSILVSDNNSNGLQQIQASSIDRIEIITNPSAKYDASGMSGIVNIVLKKDQTKGLNGSISSNFGYPNNFGLGANVNYRKNKLNFFANAGAWYINRPGCGQFRNQFYNVNNSGMTLFSTMDRTHDRRTMPMHLQVGGDYYINPKNTLTASASLRGKTGNNTSKLIYKDAMGLANNIYLITERNEKETEKESNLNFYLKHQKTFSKEGHQLNSEFQLEEGIQNSNSVFDEVYFNQVNVLIDTVDFNQLSNSESKNGRLLFKTDYTLPFGNDSKFETGIQSVYRTISDDFMVNNIISDVMAVDTNFTNNFKYEEQVHGIYSNFSQKVKRFAFQAGLRFEYTLNKSTLQSQSSDKDKMRHYSNLFPNASVSYNLEDDAVIQWSYNRRVARPTYWELNPFFTMRDRRNIFRGNPNIRPEFTDAFEMGYIKYWNKTTFSAVLYYRQTDDVIKRIQRVDTRFPESTITQTENLDFKKNYGIELTYAFNLKKWWQLNGDLNLYHSSSEGTFEYEGQDIFVGGKSYSLSSKTISRIILWDKINTQTIISYSAPRTTTQGVNRAMFAMDFASSIDILKKNGTLTLSVSDLFNSRRRRSFSEDDTFYSEDNFLWQSRAVVLSFQYRINQQTKETPVFEPLEETGGEF